MTQPGVDKNRVGLIGHDFGAMYGAILITADKRPTLYALQAFTNEMSHWYLYGPKMAGAGSDAVHRKAQAAGCNRASRQGRSRPGAAAVRDHRYHVSNAALKPVSTPPANLRR